MKTATRAKPRADPELVHGWVSGVGELNRGVGQVAAGLREIGGLFGEAGGVGERAEVTTTPP